MSPLSAPLKKDTHWTWGTLQQNSLETAKNAITSTGIHVYHNPDVQTVISSDSYTYGIGGTIMQEHDGILKSVACVSRTITATVKRYAQLEMEQLAVV